MSSSFSKTGLLFLGIVLASFSPRDAAAVDATATPDDSGKQWAIALVNRQPSENVACSVKMGDKPLGGTYRATVLTGEAPDSYNDTEHPNRVARKDVKPAFKEGVANLPPRSLTTLHVPVK